MAGFETFDIVVIGAGFFGVYAATHFASKKARVLLVESDSRPWSKASLVNQARVHLGYHYPRSIATARLAHDHRARFEAEHAEFINGKFEHYYGIDRYGSLTGAEQFVRFCRYLDIPCREMTPFEPFRKERLSALFQTHEPTFDPLLLRQHYLAKLRNLKIETLLGARILEAGASNDAWRLVVSQGDRADRQIACGTVLNATYCNINSVNALFDFEPLDAVYELSEIAIVEAPPLAGYGLTVMDGPYLSAMPFGCSSFHSLSSVLYTHHAIDRSRSPSFDCQSRRSDCSPDNVRVCASCAEQPRSNFPKFLSQLRHYLNGAERCSHHGSLFTIKTKLQSSHIDDARPTDIRVLSRSPQYAYVFSGKINSVYEVEQLDVC